MKFTFLKQCIVATILSLFCFQSQAQQDIVQNLVEKAMDRLNLEGIEQVEGILSFRDEEHFRQTIDVLELSMAEDVLPENFDLPEGFDSPTLLAFEQKLNFKSLRSIETNSIYNQLKDGVLPEDLEKSWLIDNIIQTIINPRYRVRIGRALYKFTSSNGYIKILDGDLNTLQIYEDGGNIDNLPNIEVVNSSACDAKIGVNGFELDIKGVPIKINASISLEVPFTFEGTPQSAGKDEVVTYTWTFGDGAAGR
jgi:hypothetical protein